MHVQRCSHGPFVWFFFSYILYAQESGYFYYNFSKGAFYNKVGRTSSGKRGMFQTVTGTPGSCAGGELGVAAYQGRTFYRY